MSQGGILRSAGQVAIGTLMSRITGFVRTLALAALLGSTLTNDAYNVANTLPNMVYELLLGGVLTSIIVPLLVRAEKDAEETGGDPNAYAQRLFTLATIGLTIATLIGIAIAGWLVSLQGIGVDRSNHDTARLMAMLLLPQMIFYGIGALAGAVLNTRDSYRAFAWAPVLNNVVVIAVAVAMIALQHGGELSTTSVVVLSIGTTLGIVAQALVLIPSWRKAGFRWKWRTDFRGVGLGELRSLAVWVVGYVIIGQIGFIVATNVANAASNALGTGEVTKWSYAALLFQLPYGILGVSLLTAIMPKMSRAARDHDWPAVKQYLADGTRLTGLGLIPITVAFWILAAPLTVLFFNLGSFDAAAARSTGLILAASSFGLLPYAISLLQLRVFFAAKDSRTPTILMVWIVVVRIVLSLICLVLPPEYIVLGLAVANSLAFTIGALLGDVVLRRRFGPLGSSDVVRQLVRITVAAVVGVLLATPVYLWLSSLFSGVSAWNTGGLTGAPLLLMSKFEVAVVLAVPSAVGLVGFVAAGIAMRLPDLTKITRRLRR